MSATISTVHDPVCGMEVDPKAAADVVERDGEKFYFCSKHCRDAFEGKSKTRQAGKRFFCSICPPMI
jgi:Cu+-exporting ATPase